MSARRRLGPALTIGVAVAVVVTALAFWLRPGGGAIDDGSVVHGDADLAAAALQHLPDGVYGAVIAEVTPAGTRTATVGVPLEATVEIGSISKGLTAFLYADAVERGEVSPDTRLGELLDLGDAPAAAITLEELAQHRSGLPRLPSGVGMLVRGFGHGVLGTNPYSGDPADLLDDLRAAELDPPDATYSNLGFAALGLAVVSATDTDYGTLLRERLVEPLGLTGLSLPASRSELGPEAVEGRDQQGRRPDPWINEAYAPTGTGIRSDAQAMALLAEAMLAGTVPGASAMEPSAEFSDGAIGAAWFTDSVDGAEVIWHNGGTGGFTTWFGIDHDRGTAVFVGVASNESVDHTGQALLREARSEA